MRLRHDQYVEHIRSDASRIHAVAGRDLNAPVPSCPGWTVRDAVEHVAVVYRHKVACIREKVFPNPWPPAVVANVYLDRWPELPVDATVSGDPVPMYLWLWGRGPNDKIGVDGDGAAVDHLDVRLRLATQ